MAKDKTTLLAGTLDLIVLTLLQAGPANGSDITQRIQLLSQDALSRQLRLTLSGAASPRGPRLDYRHGRREANPHRQRQNRDGCEPRTPS